MQSGRVPMFKMRPQRGTLWSAIVILVIGVVAYFDGHKDPGNIPAQDRAQAILAISIVVSGILLIIATGRMWFRHLWHDRYGRR